MKSHEVRCFHGLQKERYGYEKSVAHENGKIKWNELIEKNESVKTEDLLADSASEVKEIQAMPQ